MVGATAEWRYVSPTGLYEESQFGLCAAVHCHSLVIKYCYLIFVRSSGFTGSLVFGINGAGHFPVFHF